MELSNAKPFRVAMLLRVSRDISRIRQMAGNQYLGCTFDYFEVDTLEDLCSAYRRLHHAYDGILTSGLLSDQLIAHESARHGIPHRYFSASVENYYRVILMQLMRNPQLSLGDIRLDMMQPGQSLPDIIEGNLLGPLMEEEKEAVGRLEPPQVVEFERDMIRRHEQTIQTQQYKLFITRSDLAARTFERRHVPYVCMDLTAHEVFKTIKGLRRDMELHELRGSQVAGIYVNLGEEPGEELLCRAERALTDFQRDHREAGLMLRRVGDHFEALTDAQALSALTQGYQSCQLTGYLYTAAGCAAAVGYGIGRNVQGALENAATAARYAASTAHHLAQTFLVGSDGQITALKAGGAEPAAAPAAPSKIFEPAVNEIAKRSHLSSRTVFTLMMALRRQYRTEAGSDWLVRELSVSPRMANKILANLEKAGYAHVSGKHLWGGKGRPSNVYTFHFN